MGKGLHEQYLYCRNISHISAFLWGYVLIWYACGDGGVADEKTAVNQRFLPDFGHKRVPGRKIGQLSMRISAGIWWDRLERRNRI